LRCTATRRPPEVPQVDLGFKRGRCTNLQIQPFHNLYWIRYRYRLFLRNGYFGDLSSFQYFWPYFHCTCAETACYIFPLKFRNPH